MPERRIEWRVVDSGGHSRFRPHADESPERAEKRTRDRVIGLARNWPHDGPFRVQSRVVTVGDWKDET